MSRTFKTADYAATLESQVRLGECLPSEHLARFVVDMVGLLDLSGIYGRYGAKGGQPYDPRLLLGVITYGYLTGVFSSRKLERATYESIPVRYIAGNLHPDHDTLATFRRTFLTEVEEGMVQILLIAQQVGVLDPDLDVVSQDGSKIHADASKSQAVSFKRLLALEPRLRAEVAALLALAEQEEQREVPAGLVVEQEVALRDARLAQLAVAKAVLEAAAERYTAEQAEYEAKMAERAAKERRTGKKPGGKPPVPPTPGPRDTDQFNFTDPDSRIMKNGTDQGFDQHYNVQAVVDQKSMLVVANTLSHHPNDQAEVAPTLAAIPPLLGTPNAAALDAGYFSAANINACAARGIEPYIAPGRDAHRQTLADLLAPAPVPPPDTASPRVQMAYKLKTAKGKAIYRARKCTVEPVIGIIKEIMGFRQFSLRGAQAAAGGVALGVLGLQPQAAPLAPAWGAAQCGTGPALRYCRKHPPAGDRPGNRVSRVPIVSSFVPLHAPRSPPTTLTTRHPSHQCLRLSFLSDRLLVGQATLQQEPGPGVPCQQAKENLRSFLREAYRIELHG